MGVMVKCLQTFECKNANETKITFVDSFQEIHSQKEGMILLLQNARITNLDTGNEMTYRVCICILISPATRCSWS